MFIWQEWAEACSVGVELLLCPDVTDLELVARAETELVIESVWWKNALIREPADNSSYWSAVKDGGKSGQEPHVST